MIAQPSAGLWDASDVASFLKCSVSYVYKAADRDLLPTIRIGRMLRFDPEVVRAFARGECGKREAAGGR